MLLAAGASSALADGPNTAAPPARTLSPADTTPCEGGGPGKVLILANTVSGGCSSPEAAAAIAQGLDVDIVDDAGWAALTQPQFDAYRAIILGDATCGGSADAAEANTGTWSPVVDGNVVVVGTDPTYHYSQGGSALISKGIAFAVADAAKTGAYITLSCYYHGVAPSTPVPLLDGFGDFTVTGVGCFNNAHIVATHPALTGLTDATLSGWSCSVHEAFDSWPTLSFEVLAIAEDFGAAFTAPDGSVGTPYILARGVDVISDIVLTPDDATTELDDTHTVTATINLDELAPAAEAPSLEGFEVTFKVIDGPNAGVTGTDTTNAAGIATFTYGSEELGTDTLEATFVDLRDRTQRSNRVTNTWVEPTVETTTTLPVTTTTIKVLPTILERPRADTGGELAATGNSRDLVTMAGLALFLGGLAFAFGQPVISERRRRR